MFQKMQECCKGQGGFPDFAEKMKSMMETCCSPGKGPGEDKTCGPKRPETSENR
jgi:hypothetical protein